MLRYGYHRLKENPFTDVEKKDWFCNDVLYVYDKELMVGINDTTFAPNTITNRAMIVTILYRLEGEPAVAEKDPFPDVAKNPWYTAALFWAEENHIAAGYSNGLFGPNDPITQEQAAAFFHRYATYEKGTLSTARDFTDKDNVSPWAKDNMQWTLDNGLIVGTSDGRLAPQATTSRAEVAAMLHRFTKN